MNCHTSVERIEKHYAAHLKDMIDTSPVNVRKQRKRKDGKAAKKPKSECARIEEYGERVPEP